MKNYQLTNSLNHNEYATLVFTEKNLKKTLLSLSIPCLSSRFKSPKFFYENILFKINKDPSQKKIQINIPTSIKRKNQRINKRSNIKKIINPTLFYNWSRNSKDSRHSLKKSTPSSMGNN